MRLFSHIAVFELRQQICGHVFWVVAMISTLMVLGSVGVDALRVGVSAGGLRNGAEAVVQTHLVWTLFFMFTNAAFVADAVLRDELVGFAPLMKALPVRWRELVFGRFFGAFAAVLLCFLSVPLGILVGPQMPWVAGDSVGPSPFAALGFALRIMVVPNLLLSASIGFAFATLARSMGGALVGAIILLVGYGLGARSGATLPPVLEPFGIAAYADAIAGWTIQERNTQVPPLEGALLANRLLVLFASLLMLGAASLRISRTRTQKTNRQLALSEPPTTPRSKRAVAIEPRFDRWTALRQGISRFRIEMGLVLQTPAFAALLLLGLANAIATIWPIRLSADSGTIVRELSGASQLTPIVIALFFSGELSWRERESGIAPMLGAMPIRHSAYFLPKCAVLGAILLGLVAATGLAAWLPLILAGRAAMGALLFEWLLSASYDALIFAALAMFSQALAPNKLAGWGFIVLYLIGTLTLNRLGLTDPSWRYGRYPGWPLPAPLSGAVSTWPWRLGWALVGGALLAIAPRFVARRSAR